MNKKYNAFIKSHNLINRIFDMVVYFNLIKKPYDELTIKKYFKKNINNIEYVESLAKYFEKRLQKNYNNIELRCNLKDLISDLNYLKQYQN